MFGLGAFRNCDGFPVNDLVRKGTAELPGQGPSLARPRGSEDRETPAAQAGVLGAACAGSPMGTGRLREPNRACRTVCQTPLLLREKAAAAASQNLHLGWLQAMPHAMLAPHRAARSQGAGARPPCLPL